MTKEKKMANRVPTALANAMAAVASLRDFVRRSFFRLSICISLAFINCLFRVAFLPAKVCVCSLEWKITTTIDEIRASRRTDGRGDRGNR